MKLPILFFLLGLAATARAEVIPMNKSQLHHALKEGAPCCVIDGRIDSSRKKQPLDDALPYKEGMQINPTAAVVVIADGDKQAMRIAKALDAAYPGKRIIAVQGGVGVWEAVQVQLSREAASAPPGGMSFMIPRNTCESGSSIQNLKSKLTK
jgi:hypothetical protein